MFITLVGKLLLHLWEYSIIRLVGNCTTLVGIIRLHLMAILFNLWELLHQNYFITLVGPTNWSE